MEKKNKFIEYKKDIIRAIDKSMDFLNVHDNRFSCGVLGYYLGIECTIPDCVVKEVMREYHRVCRARQTSPGFRGYTHEQWSNKCENEQLKIRIKKLEKLKKHFIYNY